VAASRAAVTAFRKHHRETAIDDLAIMASSCNPDIALLGVQLGSEFETAFRSSFAALAPRERNLLRYQVLDRLGIDRIGALHGVHRATAARWIAHARKALIEGVRRRLQDRLNIDRKELDSTLRQLASRIELSPSLAADTDADIRVTRPRLASRTAPQSQAPRIALS
jgi:RNA polymerase sigma-70 factor (ECF subfamily)